MISSTLRLFYFISLINAFARISRQTSLDYENIGNFRDFDGDTFLLLKDLCIKLSTSLVFHKDLVKDIVWTGVYYWGVFFQLQKTCFNVKLIEPTVEAMQDAHNQMDEYLATKPHDWYAASLHIIIKDHLNTREMLLYQDPGSPQGHFNAVPRTMLPQRSVQSEEQESMDMFDLRLQVLHTSSATCPNAKFLFILMCDAGAILLTTVEDNSNCPDKETLDEVINSFTMPLGRYSCEAYLNMTSYFIYNF